MQNDLLKKGIVFGIITLVVTSGIFILMPSMKAGLTDGLIGYWSFNSGTANDDSGNGHHGTVYGATIVEGKSGDAYSFNGDDYISLPDFTSSYNQGTFVAWVKHSIPNGQVGLIYAEADEDAVINKPYIWFGFDGGKLYFARDVYGMESNYQGKVDVGSNDGLWHCVVFLSTGSANRFYFDGVEVFPTWQDGNVPAGIWFNDQTTDTNAIGVCNQPSHYGFFNGVIDEVRMYDRALTSDEIQNLFNPPSLVGYWNFDEGSGNILHDSSEYGYDGVINGATWTTGISGGALSFDGINDYVQFSSPVLNTPPYTVCAWVKALTLPGGSTAHILSNGGNTQTSYGFYFSIEYANNWQFGAAMEGGNVLHLANSPASTENWYFLVGIWDGSSEPNHLKLFVNGEPLGTYISSQPWSTGSAHNLRMAAPSDQLNYLFHGFLDEVRIYNRILTDNEIIELSEIIENESPTADPGGPYYANVNNAITFDGSGSSDTDGTIAGYRWDWTNDGTYDTDWLSSATTTHSYSSVGTYTVKLEVKDDDGATDNDTATATITSEGEAIPTAEANGPYSGYVNHPISFSSAGSVGGSEGFITSWYWTFGDEAVSSQQNPTHTYTSSGTFTVTLKVTNNYGQTHTDTTTATISDISPEQFPPVANAGGPYTGIVGTPITFNGSGSIDADGTIVSYLWNFGDSTTGTGVSPTHTYTIAGNYTVILTVTDNESLTHSNSTTAYINVSGPPTIVISVDISNIEPIEEENEKTIPVTVFCYHQTVSNIHLEILESSNLTVTLLSPNITLNPGESRELLINVKAPKLTIPKNSQKKVGDETIKLRAVGDDNVTSNIEQINIKVIEKGATPGFELVFVLCAIAIAIVLWRRKSRK